jgi:DNA mismatch repair protein MutS
MTTTDAEKHASDSMPEQAAGKFVSLLFADPKPLQADPEQRDCFVDLHLNQIVAAATAGREEYELRGFYHQPLEDPAQVRYRQDVLDELRGDSVRDAVNSFAEQMRLMRRYARVAQENRHGLSRQRWFLEAAAVYRDAAQSLGPALEGASPRAAGLVALAHHLSQLLSSAEFERFASASSALQEELSGLEYSVTIKGARVQVDAHDAEKELAPQVEETFARFAQGEVPKASWRFKDLAGLNHVEEQVLDRVARLFPEPFGRLREFCERYGDVFDERLMRFDREVQFYLGYLEFIEPLIARGLQFSRVDLNPGAGVVVRDAFDLSLAAKLAADGSIPVTNEFHFEGPERVLVVSGPNQGGKTTFARMIGQVHYLASLGLLVPAGRAALSLPDRVFTHFEREESLETLRGKFEDELVRIHGILEAATDRSVLVMNESFGSTTLADGLLVGREIVRQIIELGSLCVFVTFIDELASLGPETVSMMSTVVPEDPSQRTFRIERKPADGLAYAAALARKYRLGYDDLRKRIAS